MATRDRSVNIAARYFTFNSWWTYFTVQPANRVTSNTFLFQRVRNGSGVLNWKKKIANHEDATSDFTATYDSAQWNGKVGGVIKYSKDSFGNWSQNGPLVIEERLTGDYIGYQCITNPFTGTGWIGNADGRASNKFLSAVRETQTRFSAPTFIGELRETQRMLRKPAAALWDNILGYEAKLKKAKFRNPKRWIYSIPDLWLEQAFGWKPLMMDIEDAWGSLKHLLQKEHTEHISKAAVDNRHVGDQLFYQTPIGMNYMTVKLMQFKREESIVRYRGDVVVQAATTFADTAARWGFNPEEFVATAWELLPWSFLVDYFTTIGDFIDASGARTSSLKWVCKTVRTKSRDFKRAEVDPKYSVEAIPKASQVTAFSTEQSPAWSTFERRRITRTKGEVPVPDLSIRWEGPKWGQIANMSALLGSFNANLHFQTPRRRNYRL